MDIRDYNRQAWDQQVEQGNQWTLPVSAEIIAAARRGDWGLLLTPTKFVPRNWFPTELHGVKILCLASGGGQQGPVLAATGAHVTVFDNSPKQLEQDQRVAEREGLAITILEGDMRDLSCFPDGRFDLIFHPVSNIFVPEIRPVWREAFRVLRRGGNLLAGFNNPILYLFDMDKLDQGIFDVRFPLPYSDLESLSAGELQDYKDKNYPLEFSHTLEEQIGGQLETGFLLAGFYEDIDPQTPLSSYTPLYMATRAIKP